MIFSDIPDCQHFAIITAKIIHVPGDERSRTHPGHGYPAHTVSAIHYEHFVSRDAWEARIRTLESKSETFRAMMVSPAKITTSVTVNIDNPRRSNN